MNCYFSLIEDLRTVVELPFGSETYYKLMPKEGAISDF